MSEIDYFKPIRNFGYFFIGIPILFFAILIFASPSGPNEPHWIPWGFITFCSLFHIALGFGILSKKNWGLVFFKAYLKILYFGFPIGTYISKKTFEYMNAYKIQRYFN